MSILIVGLAVSARLIFGSAIPFLTETPMANPTDPRTTLAALEPVQQEVAAHATKPIDALRVGDRVLAANPEISDLERSTWQEPRWDEWIHLSLKMPLPAHPPTADLGDGNGTPVLNVELLRPEQWFIEQVGFVVRPRNGNSPPTTIRSLVDVEPNTDRKRVAHSPLRPAFRHLLAVEAELDWREMDLVGLSVELDLPEMGAVGTAYVTSIEPSVSVHPGEGQVVTATFSHPPSSAVLDVHFQDGSAPVGVTDNHPFWSVDQQRFVPIGEMEIGERVVTFHGETKRIESKLPRPGPQWVYNLEVYGEHVYFVGEQGLLVHNSYQSKADRIRNKSQVDLLRDEAFAVLKSARRHVEKEMRRDPRFSGLLQEIGRAHV